MKFLSILAAAAALTVSAVSAQGKFKVHATYTDNMIDVGNLDIFKMVWHNMYENSDSRGGLADHSDWVFTGGCHSRRARARLNTRVILDGQWGTVGRVNGWQMRDALISTMWNTVRAIGRQYSYPVYRGCSGFTWQETIRRSPNSACGPVSGTRCPCRGESHVECDDFSWGHRMPSIIRINVYNANRSLRADAYQARISSQRNASAGGCGRISSVISSLAGFVPGVGRYFEAGITVACRTGSWFR